MTNEAPTQLCVVAGPDAGRVLELSSGRHLIGRAAGIGQIADPMIEAHHALIDIDPDGRVRLLQLTGRFPVRVDGRPVEGWTTCAPGSIVELGQSRVHFGRGGDRLQSIASGAVHLGWRCERLGDEPGSERAAACEVDLTVFDRVAIAGPHAVGVAAAISHQLSDQPDWQVTSVVDVHGFVSVPAHPTVRQLVVCRVSDVVRYAALWSRRDVSALVIVTDGNRVPEWCGSLLHVGSTWHGEWWPDRHSSVTDVDRLHLSGSRHRLPSAIVDRHPAPVTTSAPTRVPRCRPTAARCSPGSSRSRAVTRCVASLLAARHSPGTAPRLRAPPRRRPGSTGHTS